MSRRGRRKSRRVSIGNGVPHVSMCELRMGGSIIDASDIDATLRGLIHIESIFSGLFNTNAFII